MGFADKETVQRAELLMKELGVKPEDRPVVAAARQAAEEARLTGKGNDGIFCGAAIELDGGAIVTGKNSPLMHAASSLVLNAVKRLAEVPDRIHLLSPAIVDSVGKPQAAHPRGQVGQPGCRGGPDQPQHQRLGQPDRRAGPGEAGPSCAAGKST